MVNLQLDNSTAIPKVSLLLRNLVSLLELETGCKEHTNTYVLPDPAHQFIARSFEKTPKSHIWFQSGLMHWSTSCLSTLIITDKLSSSQISGTVHFILALNLIGNSRFNCPQREASLDTAPQPLLWLTLPRRGKTMHLVFGCLKNTQ